MSSPLAEIARRAGVSPSTVTRVLHGPQSYKRPFYAKRAALIQSLAAELNYRPNAAARAIRTGRFGVICVLSGTSGTGSLPPMLLDGLAHAATAAGYTLSLARMPEEEFTDGDRLPAILRTTAADGLIINYTYRVTPALESAIAATGLPGIWMNINRRTDAVYFNDRGGVRDAVTRLVELGHRRIAYIHRPVLPNGHYSAEHRLRGYVQAMTAAGLPRHAVPLNEFGGANFMTSETLRELFTGRRQPTAIIVEPQPTAVIAGLCRLGIRIPEDLAVCAITRRASGLNVLPVARLAVPDWELGVRALEAVVARIGDPRSPFPSRLLDVPIENDRWLLPPPRDQAAPGAAVAPPSRAARS